MHNSLLSGGGIEEIGGRHKIVEAHAGGETRTYAAESICGKGKLLWIRGSVPGIYDNEFPENEWFRPERLCTAILTRLGWQFSWGRAAAEVPEPTIAVSRSRNAFYFSGMNRNTLIEHRLEFPFGAPILTNSDLKMLDGSAVYRFGASWHRECRIFVRQETPSLITCHLKSPCLSGITRWYNLSGLENAEIVVFPEHGLEENLAVLLSPSSPYVNGKYAELDLIEEKGFKFFRTKSRISGNVLIYW